MKTLIIAGNQHHAARIRHQLGEKYPYEIQAAAPHENLSGQRYATILVTDLYARERYFATDAEAALMDAWLASLSADHDETLVLYL